MVSLRGLLSYEHEVVNLSAIYRLVRTVWMYHPPSKLFLLTYLQKLHLDTNEWPSQQAAVEKLQNLAKQIRPLLLLSRIYIVRHMLWKNIGQLAPVVPQALVYYLQYSEISRHHLIHTILTKNLNNSSGATEN